MYAKNNKVTLLFESAGSRQRLIDLRFLSHGYETIKKEVFINGGDILMWDDLVLQPISRRSAATVAGRVTLESNADPAGAVIVINGSDVAVADDDGYFVAYPVAPGDLRVSVTKAGYDSTPENVHVKPGETATRNLRAYRYRYAHVRWVYQPDGSRDFTCGTEAGESWLSITGLNRISFAKGFSEVNGRSDFFVYQDGDKLRYKHFDQTGYDPQGSVYLDDVDFDALDEAPKDGYDRRRKMCLHPGMVIVVACYDGKHFGKLQVLEITDQAPECH